MNLTPPLFVPSSPGGTGILLYVYILPFLVILSFILLVWRVYQYYPERLGDCFIIIILIVAFIYLTCPFFSILLFFIIPLTIWIIYLEKKVAKKKEKRNL